MRRSPLFSSTVRNTRSIHTSHKRAQSSAVRRPTRGATAKEKLPNSSDAQEVDKNEVGVQLLSRSLHSQIFRDTTFPPPDPAYVRISREHLAMHGLDPAQSSVLPNVDFTLPPLQGKNLDEHFHRVGSQAAQPYLSLAEQFAATTLSPIPEHWEPEPGWTKYYADGSFHHVETPGDEAMLSFDIETMPSYHHHAVMACAASADAWYAWISPWLLGQSSDPKHLIPLGDPSTHRVVVGHNVSYDRARVLEEYSIHRTNNRYLDTMALHVAVNGISSHQRPAWMNFRKSRQEKMTMDEEAADAVRAMLKTTELDHLEEQDETKRVQLRQLRSDVEESLPQLQLDEDQVDGEESKRWEEITSASSLADIAFLHCGIQMDKAARSDFMTSTPEEIRADLSDYLNYCARDVEVTHAVFCKVLPSFRQACPSPVSFAGMLSMGNSFLTVDESWETYIQSAEAKYRELEDGIRLKLVGLAEEAKDMMAIGPVADGAPGPWENDPWLKQLDWSPKIPGPSRGITQPSKAKSLPISRRISAGKVPGWYHQIRTQDIFSGANFRVTIPLLLRMVWNGFPMVYSSTYGWVYRVPRSHRSLASSTPLEVLPGDELSRLPFELADPKQFAFLPIAGANWKEECIFDSAVGREAFRNETIKLRRAGVASLAAALFDPVRRKGEDVAKDVLALAKKTSKGADKIGVLQAIWLKQLDWTEVDVETPAPAPLPVSPAHSQVVWPKWYWEITAPKKDKAPGTLDITTRSKVAPLLLRLRWQNWPLFRSREHGWLFRVPVSEVESLKTGQSPVTFSSEADLLLQEQLGKGGYQFFKLPHPEGDKANVGSPLAKTFMKYAAEGVLTSPGDDAKAALDMNAQCSYWISVRDRVMNQMVVWEDENVKMGLGERSKAQGVVQALEGSKQGIILPQVVTMGTVTRRAVERTWLTASNAKANRVGSELKSMVRAPPGYAIVGADVDSEELWISSVMGDAQFGVHGATAIGWMTLEGTKAAGTDLHSKTASILGISRNQAKVFNYSRIYGAGKKHAMLLLLQSNAAMSPKTAEKLADDLYISTKGKKSRTDSFGRKFWHGGTESFLFNKLEEIALSDRPQTPVLGCGITHALSKEHLQEGFGKDFLPSRINWVVQSSGVDYLHLLIVAMEHLIQKYQIDARYLISVHDELRYLVREEDKYRAAMALQVANLWTRCLFAYRLGMDDLPQGVAFFSAVDVDHVLRKEVDMPCITPSQPNPIPPGESLDIASLLDLTKGGSLRPNLLPMEEEDEAHLEDLGSSYRQPDCLAHRATEAAFLKAQVTQEPGEIAMLANFRGRAAAEKAAAAPPKKQYKRRAKPSPPTHVAHPLGHESELSFVYEHDFDAEMLYNAWIEEHSKQRFTKVKLGL
ncbi:hypothetical protein BOTBODRAFT_175483 [Botryobasidium botryosum FD-172 SS1]|uniref:DNA-directed DNA polymerase n=1 Tax=Botryobasidium botryosum (strain FD-172 SS1) TaxID=930990 RepID=A0A067MNL6_BOTB1|nr:hypothetical protein BOTBODRAFT_175483 [Botryobasidium botryosum FD-172 SS1]